MGSTRAFKTGLAHGRRKNALTEEISRSPTAKRVTVIYNDKKIKKGVTERRGSEGNCEWRGTDPRRGLYNWEGLEGKLFIPVRGVEFGRTVLVCLATIFCLDEKQITQLVVNLNHRQADQLV